MTEEDKSKQNSQKVDAKYLHQAYGIERRFWTERMHAESSALDKSLLTLASSGIGLTIIIITQMTLQASIAKYVFLCFAWLSYCISIWSVHQSHVLSQEVSNIIIDQLDKQFIGGEYESLIEKRNRQSKKLGIINRLARYSFWIAIVFTLIFASIAFWSGDSTNEKPSRSQRPHHRNGTCSTTHCSTST